MNWITLFDIAWLTSLLVLLFLIWRSSERHRTEDKERAIKFTTALVEIAQKDAESVRQMVLTCQELVAILKEERHVL